MADGGGGCQGHAVVHRISCTRILQTFHLIYLKVILITKDKNCYFNGVLQIEDLLYFLVF